MAPLFIAAATALLLMGPVAGIAARLAGVPRRRHVRDVVWSAVSAAYAVGWPLGLALASAFLALTAQDPTVRLGAATMVAGFGVFAAWGFYGWRQVEAQRQEVIVAANWLTGNAFLLEQGLQYLWPPLEYVLANIDMRSRAADPPPEPTAFSDAIKGEADYTYTWRPLQPGEIPREESQAKARAARRLERHFHLNGEQPPVNLLNLPAAIDQLPLRERQLWRRFMDEETDPTPEPIRFATRLVEAEAPAERDLSRLAADIVQGYAQYSIESALALITFRGFASPREARPGQKFKPPGRPNSSPPVENRAQILFHLSRWAEEEICDRLRRFGIVVENFVLHDMKLSDELQRAFDQAEIGKEEGRRAANFRREQTRGLRGDRERRGAFIAEMIRRDDQRAAAAALFADVTDERLKDLLVRLFGVQAPQRPSPQTKRTKKQ